MLQVIRGPACEAFTPSKRGWKRDQSEGLDKPCQSGMVQAASAYYLYDSVIVDREGTKLGRDRGGLYWNPRRVCGAEKCSLFHFLPKCLQQRAGVIGHGDKISGCGGNQAGESGRLRIQLSELSESPSGR